MRLKNMIFDLQWGLTSILEHWLRNVGIYKFVFWFSNRLKKSKRRDFRRENVFFFFFTNMIRNWATLRIMQVVLPSKKWNRVHGRTSSTNMDLWWHILLIQNLNFFFDKCALSLLIFFMNIFENTHHHGVRSSLAQDLSLFFKILCSIFLSWFS